MQTPPATHLDNQANVEAAAAQINVTAYQMDHATIWPLSDTDKAIIANWQVDTIATTTKF